MKRNKHEKKSLCLVLMLGFVLTGLQAQTTVSTAGGSTSGTQGSVSYTVGQIFYTTTTGAGVSVSHGVQQPFEISVVSGIDEAKYIGLNWTAHPNPVTDNLRLTLGDLNELLLNNLYYQLLDITGKVLSTKQITELETTIPMNGLVGGNYLLRIYSNKKSGLNAAKEQHKEMKTFKIIKNNN